MIHTDGTPVRWAWTNIQTSVTESKLRVSKKDYKSVIKLINRMNVEENTSQSTCQGCLRVLREFLPVDFKREIVSLCFLALPVVRSLT